MTSRELELLDQGWEYGRPALAGVPGSGFLLLDAELRVVLAAGPALGQMIGGAARARPVFEFIPATAWERLAPRYHAALSGLPQAFSYAAESRRSSYWVEIDPLWLDDEVAGVALRAIEIPTHGRDPWSGHEAALTAALDALEEGLIVLDARGEVVQANTAARGLLGEPLPDGRWSPEWCTRLQLEVPGSRSLDEVARGALHSGRAALGIPVTARDAAGMSVRLGVNLIPVPSESGAPAEVVSVFFRVRDGETSSEALLAATLDSLTDEVAVIDSTGEIVLVNQAWNDFALANGSTPDAVLGNYLEVCDTAGKEDGADEVACGLRAVLAGETTSFSTEYPCHAPDEQRWFELHARRFGGGGPARVVITHTDVTGRRLAAAALSKQAVLFDATDVAVVVCDLLERVQQWNPGAELLFGWNATEALGCAVQDLISPTDLERVAEVRQEIARAGAWVGELTVQRRDGQSFPALFHVRVLPDPDGEPSQLVFISSDLTDHAEHERELARAQNFLLTVADSVGQGLFTLDADGRVTYMNPAAEELLGWAHDELRGQVMHHVSHQFWPDGSPRPIEECPILDARRHGRRVRIEEDAFVTRAGSFLPVAYTAAPFRTEEGIEGCVVVFEDITERREREVQLRQEADRLVQIDRVVRALNEDRFVLYAQPIIDLASREIVQRELLIRMRAPDGSIVPPNDFLPLAEEYGMIAEIDRWVVQQGTFLAARAPVEINLSAVSLGDSTMVDHIERCLRIHGAPPEQLVVEITETALIRDQAAALEFAERLRNIGVKLALDDFGTGYGGMAYLKHFPVDYLKIDVEFVRDLASNPVSERLVRNIVALAESFGMKTVAEGVEDAPSLALLGEIGVDYAQGYHIGRPAPS